MYRHQPESGTDITRIRSRSRDAIASVFTQVVIILGREGLIGREMFAIDGVKLPPNAFKYRSATRDEFIDQAQKLDGQIKTMLDAHHRQDTASDSASTSANDLHARRLARITREAAKIKDWLKAHPKIGVVRSGNVRKSNLTDNESAKISSDKGVLQGYCGAAVVDAAHQVIVEASALGTGSEQEILMPALMACADQRSTHTSDIDHC